MAVPKRRKSRSRTRSRRARWLASATAPDLVEMTTVDGRRIKVLGTSASHAARTFIR